MPILRILKRSPTDIQGLTRLLRYVTDVKKTKGMTGGIGVSIENASASFALVHEANGWKSRRLACHWLLSFENTVKIDFLTALELTRQVAGFWTGYQQVFGIHYNDTIKNLHVHAVTNRISALTGEIIDTGPSNLFAWKIFTNSILMATGLDAIKILKGDFDLNNFYAIVANNGFVVTGGWEWAAATAKQYNFEKAILMEFADFNMACTWAYSTYAYRQFWHNHSMGVATNLSLPQTIELNKPYIAPNYQGVLDIAPISVQRLGLPDPNNPQGPPLGTYL